MEKLTEIPLNGYQMVALNPDAKLYTYVQLYKFKTIDELFRDTDKVIILYLLQSKNQGHWCCLFKQSAEVRGFPCYNFFDPYGYITDHCIDILSKTKKSELHEQHKYLSWLLRDERCYYNNIRFQDKTSQTCGCHTTYRLHHQNSTSLEYAENEFLDKGINNPDDFVAEWCFNKLGIK